MQKKTNPKPFKIIGGAICTPHDFPSIHATCNHLVTIYEEYACHRESDGRPPVPQAILDEYKFDINMDDFKYERTSNGCARKAMDVETKEMVFTVSLRTENGDFALLETHRRLHILAECIAWVFDIVEGYYRELDGDHLKSMNQAIIYRVFWETVSEIAAKTIWDGKADEEDRMEDMIKMLRYLNYWRRELDYLELGRHLDELTFAPLAPPSAVRLWSLSRPMETKQLKFERVKFRF